MITVQEAESAIFKDTSVFSIETISIHDALGRVLREDLIADRDLPPFHRSLMDGIAVSHEAFSGGRRKFSITQTVSAGMDAPSLKGPQECVEIMTGAVVPNGLDCVIPVEQVQVSNGEAQIVNGYKAQKDQFIHYQGSDYQKGSVLVDNGCVINPQVIAVAASTGRDAVSVSKMVRIAVVSTGDELVDVDQPVKPYQIRQSNEYALKAIINRLQFAQAEVFYFPDNKEKLKAGLAKLLNNFDVIVSTGGVSMGKFDFLPEVLSELGIEKVFHKIHQKPGKPMWFGKSKDGKPVFALPGNPVSAQILAYRYVVPYLRRSAGINIRKQFLARLDEDYNNQTDLSFFLPVSVVSGPNAALLAKPRPLSGSGDFVGLTKADGFLELPPEKRTFKKGERFPYFGF